MVKIVKIVNSRNDQFQNYHFVPVGVETYGAYAPQGIKLVKQIGGKNQKVTREKLSIFLVQSISMPI